MRRIPLHAPILLLALLLTALPAGTAAAAERCPVGVSDCATVRVPLDYSRPAGPKIGLAVQRVRSEGARRTVLVLSGGPGQSITPGFDPVLDEFLRELLGQRDILVFDARGTGESGLLRCPELQKDPHLRGTRAAAACARRLGPRRGFYGIDEHVRDIESVRRRLGIRRLDLFGTSYGTLVALRYAQAYPDRVGRLLLDSVARPAGMSALGEEIFGAMPRVLNELCGQNRCLPYTRDLTGRVRDVVERIRREGPLTARLPDARGRARVERLGVIGFLDILLEGDFNSLVREAMPAAVIAAHRGDPAPLVRLSKLVAAAAPAFPAQAFSAGAYAAGSCENLEQPWDTAAPPAERLAQAAERVRALGDGPFRPFDALTVLDADYLALCLRWPAPRDPIVPATDALPRKPMLLLSGAEDLRTPVEEAVKIVAAVPGARHLVVPRTGHSVLGSDTTGCAREAAADFLLVRRTRVRSCRGPSRVAPKVPLPPTTLDLIKAPRGVPARIGVTVQAVDLALDDVALALGIGALRGGGLRGGSFRAARGSVVLRDYEYAPGIRVDATPRSRDGALVITTSGPDAARGRLVLSARGRISGVLGGRRIRTFTRAGPPTSE